jgi:hypothetical protein
LIRARAIGGFAAALLSLALGATAPGEAAAAAAPAAASGSPVAGAPARATTKVAYVSGGSIYLDAGRDRGAAAGDSAEALRDGRRIAGLIIREVTSRRAVCDTFGVVAMPTVGDVVRYTAREVPDEALPAASDTSVADTGAAPARPITSGRARRAWRGRIGAGYLVVDPENGSAIRQPTLDLRLDRAGGGLDLHADVRGRSTTLTTGTDRQARVYRLSATLHDDASRRRVTFGRQVLSAAPGAAFFDGGVAEFDRGSWTLGLFGGGAPEPNDFAPSFSQIQTGGFARVHRSRDRWTWSATLGVLDSRYKGTIDRDAVFVDASHTSPSHSFFVSQEVDVNPSWKRDLGDPSVSATSTFFFGRQSFGRRVTLDAGFDNRRSVRLARDRETSETTFDDRFRQGGWSGLTFEPSAWFRLGGSGRWSGGLPHASRSFTGTMSLRPPKSSAVALRLRATRVEGGSTGWLQVAEGEWSWGPSGRVVVSGGSERWTSVDGFTNTLSTWQGLEVERSLGARVFGFLSGERRAGDTGGSNQGQAGLSFFF